MEHASNNDVDKLRAIVFEMDKIIRALSPRKTMPFDKSIRDVDTLQEIIREKGKNYLRPDSKFLPERSS